VAAEDAASIVPILEIQKLLEYQQVGFSTRLCVRS
jgi:hypothetical protein